MLTASFYFTNEPLQWFHWRDCIPSTPIWGEFGPFDFEGCTESLFKLRQTSTLKDYILEYRHLANRTTDDGLVLLNSYFFGGPKKELKYDVKLFKPFSVHDAISIVVQLDAKLADLKPFPPKPPPFVKPRIQSPTPYSTARAKPLSLPYKKLTPEEVQKKKEKGECWFCEEKWARGRKRAHKKLLMLDICDEIEIQDDVVLEFESELHRIKLSICAFYGTTDKHNVKTMKVDGLI